MEKKKLIGRMALIGGAVAVVLAAGAITFTAIHNARVKDAQAEAKRHAAEVADRSRQYLAEVAQRIKKLPVDPAVIGDVESKYFEEYRDVHKFLWAVDNQGGFVFGVPAEAFARLNSLYDRFRERIEKEGHYASRQEFLRQLIQSHDEIDLSAFEAEAEEPTQIPSEPPDWRLRRDEETNWYVFSVPFKADGGGVLGSLYMKVDAGTSSSPPLDRSFNDAADGLTGGLGLSLAFLWFLLPTWVYVDARERNVRRAALWSFLVFISAFVGLVVYLIARPEESKVLRCPGCGREVNGGAFCPHCGHDLSTAFCPACRYPLKPDWVFCPACRTEIKPQAASAPSVAAG